MRPAPTERGRPDVPLRWEVSGAGPAREPETAQEAALFEAYRNLDEAGRVLLWSEMLTELGRPPEQPEDEEDES